MKKWKKLKNKRADRHTGQKQRRQSADLPAQNHFTALHEHGLEAQNNLHPGSKGTTPFYQKYGNNLSPICVHTPFSFTATGWNSTSLSRNAVSLKSSISGQETLPPHRQPKRWQTSEPLRRPLTLYRKHFFLPVLSSVLICNPSACCALKIRPPLTVFSKYNIWRVPPATFHSNHTLGKDVWKSTIAMWSQRHREIYGTQFQRKSNSIRLFLYKLSEKMMAVYYNEIKADFPSWKMKCDGIFFVEGTTTT